MNAHRFNNCFKETEAMNKDLKQELSALNDRDLAAVSGGAGRWWEEYGYKPQYSVG